MAGYQYHDLCLLFPPADEKTLADMAEDIKENGLAEPIYLYEGKILDGRNRYLACQRAGVRPTFKEYVGDEPLAFVLSKNLHRRHLSDSQRALLAQKILEERGEVTQEERATVADQFEVSRTMLRRAEHVTKLAILPITQMVQDGDLSLGKAESILNEAKDRTDTRIIHNKVHPADVRRFKDAQEKIFKSEVIDKQPLPQVDSPEYCEEMLTGVYEKKKFRKTVTDIQTVITKISEGPALFDEASNVVGALDQEKLLLALLNTAQKTVKDVLEKVQVTPVSYDAILTYTAMILNNRFKLPEFEKSNEHEFLLMLKDAFIENCTEFLKQVKNIKRKVQNNGKFS